MNKRDKRARVLVALFFAVLMMVGLCTVKDYTGSYDELVQQKQLRVNLKEYAGLFEKWGIRWETALQMDEPPIAEFVNRDYGMASLYFCAPFLSWMLEDQGTMSTVWGIATWIWFMIGVWSLYALARHMKLSRSIACMGAMILYLSPRFFAHGHLNDKDIILLSIVLLCLWLGARFLERMSLGRGLCFSLAGALAANLRVVGLMAWGVMGLCVLCKLTLNKTWSWKKIGLGAMVIAAFAGFYVLITPAVWYNPAAFFQYLFSNTTAFSRWSGVMYFRGAYFEIPENTLPFYYVIYMIVVTVPLYTLPLAAVGQLKALWDVVRSKGKCLAETACLVHMAATVCWVLPMAAYVVVSPIIYNGWRHFYFAFAGIAILAAYGIGVLWKWCLKRKWSKRLCTAALCLCFAVTGTGMMVNHPRQSSYYNALASRGTMETDYWNTSGAYALEKLMACEERNKELPLEVGCWFFDIQNARFKMTDEQKAVLTTTVAKDAPYMYYIDNYVHVYDVKAPEGYHELFTVESYGRKIGTMYERDM